MIAGYEDRVNDQWQIARFTAYLTYCTVTDVKDRASIYDFMPLPGDPEKDERPLSKIDALVARMQQESKQRKQPASKANG